MQEDIKNKFYNAVKRPNQLRVDMYFKNIHEMTSTLKDYAINEGIKIRIVKVKRTRLILKCFG